MDFRCGNSLLSFLFFSFLLPGGWEGRLVAIIRSFRSLSTCIGFSLFRTVLGFCRLTRSMLSVKCLVGLLFGRS